MGVAALVALRGLSGGAQQDPEAAAVSGSQDEEMPASRRPD
jgi:hypothetical protein